MAVFFFSLSQLNYAKNVVSSLKNQSTLEIGTKIK